MRGRGVRRSACGASSEESVPTESLLDRPFFVRGLRFPLQRGDELVTLVHEVLALAAAVLRPDRVLAEQRERDRRIAVGDDGVGKNAGIDLAPAHGFGRR